MKLIEILIAARAKIEKPECWVTGNLALDEDGDDVPPSSPSAACWCAEGALEAVAPERMKSVALEALQNAVPDGRCVFTFNDAKNTTHGDVLALFDRAIAKASR